MTAKEINHPPLVRDWLAGIRNGTLIRKPKVIRFNSYDLLCTQVVLPLIDEGWNESGEERELVLGYIPHAQKVRARSKYMPHQGEKEKLRRRAQMHACTCEFGPECKVHI